MKQTENWRWLNAPQQWTLRDGVLHATTDNETDFWQNTWYGFQRHSGHVYGVEASGDFTFQLRVEGDFTTLYDQAGLMLLIDEHRWLKAGIEYNDDAPMIGSVLTNLNSDWATGIFPARQNHFWLRLTRLKGALRLQYSTDGNVWPLLRLCPFPEAERYFIGAMCCSPGRAGLQVAFSELRLTEPLSRALHDLS